MTIENQGIVRKYGPLAGMVVFILIIIAYVVTGGGETALDTIEVVRQDINQEVSITGKVRPVYSADLAFERSGKILGIYVDIGSMVVPGQVLANLDDSALIAEKRQYEASVRVAEANLAKILRGAQNEEVAIYKVKLENAGISLEDSLNNLRDKIRDAYTKSDDAIRNKVDTLFSNPQSTDPILKSLLAINSQLANDIEWGRKIIEERLSSWKSEVDSLNFTEALSEYADSARANLGDVAALLDKIGMAVNSLTVSSNLSQTTIDTYRSDISTARTNINTATVNLTASVEKWKDAISAQSLADKELRYKLASATEEDIAGAEASVDEAMARVDDISAQLSKGTLRSPSYAVVTKKNFEAGEIVGATESVFTVATISGYEIEANVAEVDVAKISVDKMAKVTLDAYGNDVIFDAKIIAIDPAETMIDGVPTYKTTLRFSSSDSRVKSGMTANIEIIGDIRANVLVVPSRSIITKKGLKYVKVLENDISTEKEIEVGLRGSDGMVEVVSGLLEGEVVIVSG